MTQEPTIQDHIKLCHAVTPSSDWVTVDRHGKLRRYLFNPSTESWEYFEDYDIGSEHP